MNTYLLHCTVTVEAELHDPPTRDDIARIISSNRCRKTELYYQEKNQKVDPCDQAAREIISSSQSMDEAREKVFKIHDQVMATMIERKQHGDS